jgi:hypothetical protein
VLVDKSSDLSKENIEFLIRFNKNLTKKKKDKRKKGNLCMEEGKTAEFSELITRFSLTSLLLRLYFFQKNEKKGGGERKTKKPTYREIHTGFKSHKPKNKNFVLSP